MTLAAGIDIGATKVLGVTIDSNEPRRVLAEKRLITPRDEEPLIRAVGQVLDELGKVEAVGVGVAGLVDKHGVLLLSPNLPELPRLDLVAKLQLRLKRPVMVDNDAICAAWGEHVAGAARSAEDVLCVTLGTGVGAGIINGGEPLRGGHGFAGEAGHMVVDPNGPPCPCGRWGCWERFASGTGLARLARDAAAGGRFAQGLILAGGEPHLVRGEHVSQAAREGDQEALAIMGSFARWVSLGIGNLVTLLDCSLVVVGGGLVELGELLLSPVRASLHSDVMAAKERDVRVIAAELGEYAGAIGAALLAIRNVTR